MSLMVNSHYYNFLEPTSTEQQVKFLTNGNIDCDSVGPSHT